jgi:DNA-binding IclR family transcriptional regulator
MRLTYRTTRVLECIAAQPGVSNREVAERAGVSDQGQISKLLARLERLGLIANTGEGHARGERNAWNLTPLGSQVARRLTLDAGSLTLDASRPEAA